MGPELIEINDQNKFIIRDFLGQAGSTLATFRYFNSRDINVISNHLVTYILKIEDVVSGYGHLDRENDIIWLGIAIAEQEKGKGYGNLLMQKLLDRASELKISKIQLSVDNDNEAAIHLYKKFGFNQFKQLGRTSFYELCL